MTKSCYHRLIALLCLVLFLSGCKAEPDSNEKIPITDQTITTDHILTNIPDTTTLSEDTGEILPKVPSPTETVSTVVVTIEMVPAEIAPTDTTTVDKIVQELEKDINQDDIMDFVQVVEREDETQYIQVMFDGNKIFTCEWPFTRIVGIDAFEYLDLDRDGEQEIFITAYPNVNSRPLIEVVILKQTGGQWNSMQLPQNGNGNNCFLFDIIKGKDEFDFIITSDLTDEQILFDASSFYVDSPEANPDSIQGYRSMHYQEGETVAFISAWGIWDAKSGTYDGNNCIIAEQGIEGPSNNGLGRLLIYFDYDEQGLPRILKLEHVL